MDVKDRIVQGSLRQFMQYGFRNVSMDDIASNLGMSKKTLYQHFTEKEELVAAALETLTSKNILLLPMVSEA